MLVQTGTNTGAMMRNHHHQASSRPSPGLLDSPILQRVLLRHHHEDGLDRGAVHIQRSAYSQSLLSSNFGKESTPAIKRGLLWQHRDKLFSRWKERYFILTRDYIYCFRRASGADRISEMGQFLFKVKLVDVERVEWENKRTYSTVALILGRDGKFYLRATEGLEDWFELIEECTHLSKERRRALRLSHDGRGKDNNNISGSLGDWLAANHKIPMRHLPTDTVSTRQDTVKRREWTPSERDWEHPTLDNRLSRHDYAAKMHKRPKMWRHRPFSLKKRKILTDIDISNYDDSTSTLGAPSITSYRLNQDVLCVQPPSLRGMGSFRSTKETATTSPTKSGRNNVPINKKAEEVNFMKFRERSYSDIQREDRVHYWRGLPSSNPRRFN